MVLAGCGGNGGNPVQVKRMNLRSVADDNPMLAGRFRAVTAGYSIRPPAGWVRRKMPGKKTADGFAVFTSPKTRETLSIFVVKNGPIPTVAMLGSVRDGYIAGAKKHAGITLIGTDIFSFKGRYYVQSLVRQGDWITLTLSVYSQSGGMVFMDYYVKVDNYRLLARAIEASIASLETAD